MAHDQKHNTSSVKHGGGNVVERTCMARTRSHVLVTGDIMTSSLCFSVKLGIISVLLKKTKAKNKTNLQLRLESDPIRICLSHFWPFKYEQVSCVSTVHMCLKG